MELLQCNIHTEKGEIEPLNSIKYKSIPGGKWKCNSTNLFKKEEYLDNSGQRRNSINEKQKEAYIIEKNFDIFKIFQKWELH